MKEVTGVAKEHSKQVNYFPSTKTGQKLKEFFNDSYALIQADFSNILFT